MNPVQVVESARPEVGPMPAVERRHLRERVFDAAMRSQTEHAPVNVASPNTRAANALRLAALGVLGAVAIGGLLFSASRDTPGTGATRTPATDPNSASTTEPTRNTIVQAPPLTIAPTTTVAPAAGSTESPLLLPPERNRLDALTVTRSELGASALLLQAPDLSTISLFEVDGLAPDAPEPDDPNADPDADVDSEATTTTTLAPRQFAAIAVETPPADQPGSYRLQVPCGSVTVLDVAGRAPFRPEINQLFDSIQLDNGILDIALPPGWGAISSGPGTDEFVFGLPVDVDGRNVTITLAQYPGGSIAVAGTDQRQYSAATFNGTDAWLHRDPEDPEAFTLLAMVGTTAIRVSASGISLAQTEAVIAELTSGDVDEWTNRFGTLPVDVDPDTRTCADQPEFRLS